MFTVVNPFSSIHYALLRIQRWWWNITHMLHGIASCIDVCNGTIDNLVIDVVTNYAFRIKFTNIFRLVNFNGNYTDEICKIPNDATIMGGIQRHALECGSVKYLHPHQYVLDGIDVSNMPCKSTIHTWHNTADVIVFGGVVRNSGTVSWNHIQRYIRINIDVMNIIKNKRFFHHNEDYVEKADHEVQVANIGVHYRNTDIKTDIASIFLRVRSALHKQHTDDTTRITLYLATDDFAAIGKFIAEFPSLSIVTAVTLVKDPSITSMHYLSDSTLAHNGTSKQDLVIDTLVDIYNLSRANTFVGSEKSGMSRLVIGIREARKNGSGHIFSL